MELWDLIQLASGLLQVHCDQLGRVGVEQEARGEVGVERGEGGNSVVERKKSREEGAWQNRQGERIRTREMGREVEV